MDTEGISFVGDIFKDYIFTAAGCDCSVHGQGVDIVTGMVVVIVVSG